MKIFDSFWNPSFYKNKKEGFSFWKAFGRLFLITFLVAIVYAVTFYEVIGKNIPEYVTTFTKQIEDGYPNDLILSLEKGVLSKNIPGALQLYPVTNFIPLKDSIVKKTPQYFIAINDTQEVSLSSYTESHALLFLAKDGWAAESNKGVSINSYKNLTTDEKPLLFTKEMLLPLAPIVNKYALMASPVVMVSILVLYTIFAPLGYLLLALFIGLIVMLLSKSILGRKYEYHESYILALYALPSIIVVTKILEYTPYISNVISKIPFLTTLLVLGFLGYMFKGMVVKKEADVHATL